MRKNFTLLLLCALVSLSLTAQVSLNPIGTFETDIFDEGAAETVTYDAATQRLFFTNSDDNSVIALDISAPNNPTEIFTIDMSPFGGGVNDVTTRNGLVAVASEAEETTDAGSVVVFDIDGNFIGSVEVGALPDMLTFTPDGKKVLVANEGEPNDDYDIDPMGTVSIIDRSGSVTTVDFSAFNDAALDESVRIFGPGASVAQDLEPEYIAISPDGKTAYVAMQENNAFGVIDIEAGVATGLIGLGFKDHNVVGNGFDGSDRDDAINIANWPIFGMYQPDAIATYAVGGETYIVTANEGDAREYDGFEEEEDVEDVDLDPTAFPNAALLQSDEGIARLNITNTIGDTDNDGDFDAIYTFGGRSFSIFDSAGNLVFDSGDDFEQITAAEFPDFFNANNDNNRFDNRSDNKGPEPEAVAVGLVCGKYYAFIGLERVGGVMVYDITDPANTTFVAYLNNRDFEEDVEEGEPLDLGPEEIIFIPASESPNGVDLIAVSNEVSGTVTIYEVLQEEVCDNIPNINSLAVDFCDEPNVTIDFIPVAGATSYLIEVTSVENPSKSTTKNIPSVPFTRTFALPSDLEGEEVGVRLAAVFEDGSTSDFSESTAIVLGCEDEIEGRNTIIDASNQLEIYPNPVNNILNVSGISTAAKIQILSIEGKVVLENTATTTLDVSSLQSGIYTIKILGEKNFETKRFVKL
ncbi:MAG: choice-of-anchor I family protein [Bacteroidota bacterium]